MWSKQNNVTVLAVYPTTRGYSFALFDGPLSPYDWGTKDLPRATRSARLLGDLEALIDRYHPDVLVVEDFDATTFRRPKSTQKLYFAMRSLAELRGVNFAVVSKGEVREVFSRFGARTKSQIATVIAREIAAFKHLAPKPRRAWMAESRRQGLYDATTLGLTYYGLSE